MSINISEALKLNHLKTLKVVAGAQGLNNRIEKIGILDHEIVEGVKDNFQHGDFVLTTFTPIRNDPKTIDNCIRDLIDCKIAALAIKSIYVHTLSESITHYANKKKVPILFFKEDVYFEDIIEDLLKGLQSRGYLEIIESKIETLFMNNLKSELVEEMAYDLCPNFLVNHQVFFLKEKRYINNEAVIEIAERYKRSRHKPAEHGIFKYRDGLLMVLSYEKAPKHVDVDRDYILSRMNLSIDDYYVGYGSLRESLKDFDQSIKEAIYACQVCEINGEETCHYESIGIYKMLLPHKDEWMKKYIEDIINPIINYDEGKLIETAREFIENYGDIIKTAEKMYQHKNTIRYRIQKMKSLLNIKSDSEFYEQLSIAIKCEKIM